MTSPFRIDRQLQEAIKISRELMDSPIKEAISEEKKARLKEIFDEAMQRQEQARIDEETRTSLSRWVMIDSGALEAFPTSKAFWACLRKNEIEQAFFEEFTRGLYPPKVKRLQERIYSWGNLDFSPGEKKFKVSTAIVKRFGILESLVLSQIFKAKFANSSDNFESVYLWPRTFKNLFAPKYELDEAVKTLEKAGLFKLVPAVAPGRTLIRDIVDFDKDYSDVDHILELIAKERKTRVVAQIDLLSIFEDFKPTSTYLRKQSPVES